MGGNTARASAQNCGDTCDVAPIVADDVAGENRSQESAPEPPTGLAAWEVGEVLGQGAFGKVVRATSRRHACECAMKVVSERRGDAREAEAHCGLDHPNIARLLESFRHAGVLHIAVELCEGGELLEELRSRGRVQEGEARIAFGQIMSAVDYLHSRAVAHRDLKLDNFLLSHRGAPLADNSLRLIDFGFATRFVPGRKTMRTRCGSEGFVAPEVLAAQMYDERCDVFSCGVLLHCLLCAKMPFKEGPQQTGGPIHFGGDAVKRSLSMPARRLIERALKRVDRPSARDVLVDAWLSLAAPESRLPAPQLGALKLLSLRPIAFSSPTCSTRSSSTSSLLEALRSIRLPTPSPSPSSSPVSPASSHARGLLSEGLRSLGGARRSRAMRRSWAGEAVNLRKAKAAMAAAARAVRAASARE